MQIRAVFLLALPLFVAGAMPAARTIDPPTGAAAAAPIERFMQIAPNLYRGAQPDGAGFRFLRDLGIRTIVSFRTDEVERAQVEALGMAFVHIPVTFRPFGGDIPEPAAVRFLAVVDDPASGPIFVHCRRGADRTGAFVGLYRILRQGWNLERAYGEAREMGMRWWYPAVKGELRELARILGPARLAAAQ